MRVSIQPFEQIDGVPTWDNSLGAADYLYGQAAVNLGLHHDNYQDSEEWEEELEQLEAAVLAAAKVRLGGTAVVSLAPEYI